jgi:hypothetical protein
MNQYPRLDEMGVNNPQDIEKFLTYSTNAFDILRIIYKRKKGSMLPVSKNYKFPRIKKSVVVDSGSRQTELIYESDSAFRQALDELEQIKSVKDQGVNLSALISEEVRLLEEDVALRIDYIKSLIKKIK